MRKYKAAILSLVILISLTATAGILPTSLKITVVDRLGNRVEGARVILYKTKDDYLNQSNPINEGVTDEKGKLTFKKLEPVSYFIDVRNDSMHNDGMGAQTAPLQEGKTNNVHAVIH